MKNAISCIILLVAVGLNASAQKLTPSQQCDFFGPLHFKDGWATVVVKAVCYGWFEDGSCQVLKKQKKTYYEKYFERNCNGLAMVFAPENCSYTYHGTISKRASSDRLKLGQIVYLTCLVFKDEVYGYPRFLIDKVTYKKEDVPVVENINPLKYIRVESTGSEAANSYFSNNADSLNKLKPLIVINNKHIAYIKTEANKLTYFTREKRFVNPNGYTDFYKSNNASFELSINRIVHDMDGGWSDRNGRVLFTINNTKKAFNVYGLDRETDEYNDPKYK